MPSASSFKGFLYVEKFSQNCHTVVDSPLQRFVVVVAGYNNLTSFRRVCYFQVPYYKPLDNETAYLCTHLIVGFAKTDNGTLKTVRPSDPQQYRALLDLRLCNPDLKVILTTGISNNSSKNFSALVNTTAGRRKYAFLRLSFFD
ncbi:hypothetical protein HPB48_026807 [Haemaphysalis longicornis]|uniref:GH18 domain-containing protein n=1 Tax=Haemaphysalis longicornis TaxID=44386 RepID=A0A9J6HCS5_HAELO|nr:hypothetical protein HPB48_026807 [Haemaphysalis longicornis]